MRRLARPTAAVVAGTGWHQLAEFLPREAGDKYSKYGMYLSAGLLVAGCVDCVLIRRPTKAEATT